MFQDIRFAFRTARKNPAFASIAVATLALGIGANTAIFSIISGVLLRPLPYTAPDRLVQLYTADRWSEVGPVRYGDVEDWLNRGTTFDGVVIYGNIGKNLQGVDDPERISTVRAERGLFDLLGVQAIAGRTFRRDDPVNVVVIGAALWRRRWNADPSVIGRGITLDGEPCTVIGIMSDDFQFPYRGSPTEMWVPWDLSQLPLNRNSRMDNVVARLKPGVPLTTARRDRRASGVLIMTLSEMVTGRVRLALLTLLGAVGVVLLIACANVMNLSLARGAERAHEFAVRAALGASRTRLIRHQLTESVLLSATGGIVGLAPAWFGMGLVRKLATIWIPRASEIRFDWRVFLFLLAVSVAAGILFGILPALSASKLDVHTGLKESRGSRSTGSSGRLRDSLVVAEIALAFVLVMSAGLLLRAFLGLQNTPLGFVPDRVLTLRMSVSLRDYPTPGTYGKYLNSMEERLRQVPGVRSAGFIQYLPLQNSGWSGMFTIRGDLPRPPGQEAQSELRYVSPGYFNALGIPIVSGRTFTVRDVPGAPKVIVVNQALVRRYLFGRDPIGTVTDRGTIIGVVQDVRQSSLDRPALPEVYYCFAQNPAATSSAGVSLVVRAQGRPEALLHDVRSAIRQVNPNQVLFDIKTMDQVVANSLADANLYLWLVGIFAALAVLLAIAGVYGVVSYTVTVRTPEFAIRMALGAGPRQIWNLVLTHNAVLVAGALAIGAAGTLAVTRTLRTLLSSVTSPDAWMFLPAAMLIAAVAISACLLPARRATRVDPNVALKSE